MNSPENFTDIEAKVLALGFIILLFGVFRHVSKRNEHKPLELAMTHYLAGLSLVLIWLLIHIFNGFGA